MLDCVDFSDEGWCDWAGWSGFHQRDSRSTGTGFSGRFELCDYLHDITFTRFNGRINPPLKLETIPMTHRIHVFAIAALLSISISPALDAQDDFTATDPIAIGLLKHAEKLEAQLEAMKAGGPTTATQASATNPLFKKPGDGVSGQSPASIAAGQPNELFPQKQNPWSNFMGVSGTSPFDNPENQVLFGKARPHLEVGVDGVFVARGGLSGGTFISDDTGPLFSISDLDLGLNNGNRVTVGYFNQANSGLEFVYYGIQGASQDEVVGTNVLPTFFGFTPGTPDSSFTVDYNMNIDSYELNLWGVQRGHWRFGVGYRQVDLEEGFDIFRTLDPGIAFRSQTNNLMRGGQLMVEHRRDWTRLVQFFAVGKFGLFNNEVSVTAESSGSDSLSVIDETGSFLADINTGLRFTLTDYLQLEAGYQALLFTDVASAPEQNASLDLATGAGSPTFGNAPFHGFSFGGKLAF